MTEREKERAACQTCRWWKRAGCTIDDYAAGECRRLPPLRADMERGYGARGRGVWPLVSKNDWCGDHMKGTGDE